MKKMDIHDLAESIKTKEDFENFLKLLAKDFEENPKDWENGTLKAFLEALHAYTEDVEGFYKNMGIPFEPETPTWSVFAQLLLGAKVYE